MIKHVHACMYTSKKASRKSVFPVYNFCLVAKGRKRVLLRPEKAEKGSFTLKTDQIFSVHTKKRNLKTQQPSVTFDFFLFEKRKKTETQSESKPTKSSRGHRSQKGPFSNHFLSTPKQNFGVFQFFRFRKLLR